MANENPLGTGLMAHEAIPLEIANPECDMCRWLEQGYQTAAGVEEVRAYGTEILLHRRSFHISSADNVN